MSEAKIQRIFKHYGEQSQLKKTQEELRELDEAIQKLVELRSQGTDTRTTFFHTERDFLKDHIAEELAEVRIMLDQIELLTGGSQSCEEWRTAKLDRQIKRIQGGLNVPSL